MNNVSFIGNLTKDVDLRQTTSGKDVCVFSIAVNRPFSEETDFFPVVVWGKSAENCAKYLKKGNKVGVSGYIQNRSYETSDGVKKTVAEVIANSVEFLTPKQASESTTPRKDFADLETVQDDTDLPF